MDAKRGQRRSVMDSLLENWFFLLVLFLCVGMHFFGHGHGHGHGHGESEAPKPRGSQGPRPEGGA